MKKQEALKRIEAQKETIIELTGWAVFRYIKALIEQLDEPQKVVVPQYIADKIEYCKESGDWDLFQAMDYCFNFRECSLWLENSDNQELFALAWIFGYEVEKEPKYRISMPKARNHKNHAQFLCEKDGNFFWCGEWYPFRTKFTRKELEDAGFGWVFDCPGIEIEEVTE